MGAFNTFNGANHPELQWQRIETANCQIIYHSPLEQEATEAAKIAQRTFETLTKVYKTTPQKKCIIYISDQDNIANGATVLSFYIFVWVNQNDFTSLFTGNDKWLRKVISHEMSHWFVAVSITDFMTPFVPVSLISFPRDLNEGYAQFFSGETWGLNRGDRFLKASILSEKQTDYSGSYIGGLIYARGFSIVRYLEMKYGEDSLIKLLQYRSKVKMYNFQEAFKSVYKMSFEDFQEEWRRYMYTYYYGEVYNKKASLADTTANASINDFSGLQSEYNDFQSIDWKDSKILFVAKKGTGQGYFDLIAGTVVQDSLQKNKLTLKEIKRVVSKRNFTSISMSDSGNWISYASYTRHKYGRLAPRVYLYDRQHNKHRTYTEGNYPVVDNAGTVYYQYATREQNFIQQIPLGKHSSVWKAFDKDDQISNLHLSPDESKLAFTMFDNKKRFLVLIYDTQTHELLHEVVLQEMPQEILWQNNQTLLFTAENLIDYNLEIYQYSLQSSQQQLLASQPYNAFPVKIVGNKAYVLAEYLRGGMSLGSFQINEVKSSPKVYQANYYNRWTNVSPIYSIPDQPDSVYISQPKAYNDWHEIKWRQGFVLPSTNMLMGSFVLSEALGKHLIVGSAVLPYSSKDKAWWTLYYQNTSLFPTFSLMYSRYQMLSGIGKDKLYYQNIDQATVHATIPIQTIQSFSSAYLGTGFSYNNLHDANNNPIYDNKIFSSFNLNTGYVYNLPWRNNSIHKVRSYSLEYQLQAATDKLGMNMDFSQHSLYGVLAYAPLLNVVKSEFLRTISFENKSHFEFVNGTQLRQLLPGTDKYERLLVSERPFFRRYYLRGYEETHLSKEILNIQNEVLFKLTDEVRFTAGWNGSLLTTSYTGIALWHDYTQLHDVLDGTKSTLHYQANGIELRVNATVLQFDTMFKYGIAYDKHFKKLSDYYLIEFPIMGLFSK